MVDGERGHAQERRDLVRELAHLMMEAKKFHSLLSATWRTRKAVDVIYSDSRGLRIEGPAV